MAKNLNQIGYFSISMGRAIRIALQMLFLLACFSVWGQSGPQSPPQGAVEVPTPSLPVDRISDENDVVLMPAQDFSFEYAAALARIIAYDTGLRIRAVLPFGTRDWKQNANGQQYDPDTLKDLALPAIAQLKKNYGGIVYVVLTTRDINSADGNLRFLFAQHYPQERISVVSVARMAFGEAGKPATGELFGNRVRKMVLRSIGTLYYGLERSTDLREVMYSPIMSLDDLDAMGLSLKAMETQTNNDPP